MKQCLVVSGRLFLERLRLFWFRGISGAFLLVFAFSGCASSVDSRINDDLSHIPGRVSIVIQSTGRKPILVNASEVVPAASMAKIAIMVAALRTYWLPGHYEDRLTVAGDDLRATSRHLRLKVGDGVPVYALVAPMIESSDNLAANILISNLGVARINQLVHEAGLSSTEIFGLYTDVAGAPARARTSAVDLARALTMIQGGAKGTVEYLPQSACRFALQMLSRQADRTIIPAALGNAIPVANKTAAVVGMRGDAGIIDPDSDHPQIIVMLAEGLPNYRSGQRPPEQYEQAIKYMRRVVADAYGT